MSKRQAELEPPFVVALDVGSSSIRAGVFDATASPVAGLHTAIGHRVRTTPDGGAELDPDAVVANTVRCLSELMGMRAFRQIRGHLAAVGCSMFLHTLVGADGNGRALTPLYMWSDTRSREALRRARRRLDPGRVHQRTGCPLHTSFALAKLLWLRESRAALFRRVRRWLCMGDYLHLRLFGEPLLSYSMASGSGLLAVRSLGWDEALLRLTSVRPEQLGRLVDFSERNLGLQARVATRLAPLAGIPWFPALGDAVCSNIGSGCVDESRLALNLGTSGALRAVLPRVPNRIPDGLFCYRVDRQRVLLGGAISNCGNLRRWLLETLNLGPDGALERDLGRMRPDAHRLTLAPFLAGERAPFWPEEATGAMLGLRSATRPLDIARAALDAVCYQLALIHERLKAVLPRARCLVASGGGSASDWWMQMMADTMNTPVRLSRRTEASSRGAAWLALEALGVRRDTLPVASELGRTFWPDRKRGRAYRRALDRYRSLCEEGSRRS